MPANGHRNEARAGNYQFIIGSDKDIIMSVQESNVVESTVNSTAMATRYKDARIPSNKAEQSPLVISVLVSEDYYEVIEFFKWQMRCKNVSGGHLTEMKPCELIALDSQLQPTARFVYEDAWPSVLGGVVHTVNNERKDVVTFDVTLYFNNFYMVDKDGNKFDEQYAG